MLRKIALRSNLFHREADIRRPTPKWFPAAIIVALLFFGCAAGPDFKPPPTDVPEQYGGAALVAPEVSPAVADEALARWWLVFNDPIMNGLMQRATAANLDLKLAQARVRQAWATRGVVAGALGPSLAATIAYERSRANVSNADGPGAEITNDQYQAGFDASWEIDIFGGRRRSLEAATADLQAAEESRRDVLVSLLAEVARNYIDLRAYQQQIAITQQNLAAQQHSAKLTRERFKGGFVSGLDVANAEAQAATTAALVPLLETSAQQTIHNLSILIGQPPAALNGELAPAGAIPAVPPAVPLGIPSDLLRRRPDIRQAESRIHGATARIGVATAEFFPKFTISGAIGVRSTDFGALFDWSNHYWSFGPSMLWRLFESGRVRAGVEVQKALQEQEMILYRQTVLGALQEVENALVASTQEQRHREALDKAVSANRKAFRLAETLYTEGLTDFINVLQAQRALFLTESELVQSTAKVSTHLVALYKALGGGWEAASSESAPPAKERPAPSRLAP
jgi:NodT family efflux transporter outer membrane factor (OMF) lipoprotein